MTLARPYLRNHYIDKFKATLIQHLNCHGHDEDWFPYGRRRLVSTRYGFKMYLDMVYGYHRTIYFTGEYYEVAYGRLVARIIGPGWSFVDVGANVGFYTLMAAQSADQVYSFEPNPGLLEWLRGNIAVNGFRNVTVFDFGLSDQEAVLELQQSNSGLGEATLRGGVKFDRTSKICVTRGDDVLPQPPEGRPIFIKIDVEGWEHHVLRGLEQILRGPDVVVTVEITDEWLRTTGSSAAQLFEYMKVLGYHAYEIQKPPTRIKTVPRLEQVDQPRQQHQYDVCFTRFADVDSFWSWIQSRERRKQP